MKTNLIPATSCPWGNLADWRMPADGGPARIYKNAMIGKDAIIRGGTFWGGTFWGGTFRGTQDYLVLTSVGTGSGVLALYRDPSSPDGVTLTRGCFVGPIDEFMTRLNDSPEHAFYRAVVPMAHAELQRRMTPILPADADGEAAK